MRYSSILALGLALAACDGNRTENAQRDRDQDRDADRSHPEMRAAEDSNDAESPEATARGVISVVGSDPSPQVVISVGEGSETTQIAIVGEFREELGRLSGVEVSLAGDNVTNPQGIPEQAIDVFEYDVVSVNSAPAFLGVLELRDGELWLDRENDLRLTAVPAQLQNMAGAKVWIAGPSDGDELRVQSFGVVRER